MSDTYLLLWSCGPVQDFIASARKGRDLWFGSWLLSELSTAAAAHLMERGAELLLPSPGSLARLRAADFDVPNKVLAQVRPTGSEPASELAALADGASNAALARLRGLADQTFAKLDRHAFDETEAHEQLQDLLETAWAVTPLGGSFQESRKRVEALLAARKVTRAFAAPSFAAAGVPKSSLDGQREAVTRRGAGLKLGLTHDERLCGVGLLKRLGHRAAGDDAPGGRTASVTDFALATWLRPVIGPPDSVELDQVDKLRTCVTGLKAELEDADLKGLTTTRRGDSVLADLDAHAFYPSRHSEFREISEHERTSSAAPNLAALKHFRDDVEKETGVRLSREPVPYYAILLADGDRMGLFLDQLSATALQRASGALSDFAHEVRSEIFGPPTHAHPDRYLGGECVYAGGDDVLALVPVDRALAYATQLRESFCSKMKAVADEAGALNPPTLSVGICIAHHLSPLRDALDGAREAEKAAKQAGRNAWAVHVLKRSGAPLKASGSFDDGSVQTLMLFTEALGGAAADPERARLPHGLPYELRHAYDVLARDIGEARTGRTVPKELQLAALRRIARQKSIESSLNTRLTEIVEKRGLEPLSHELLIAKALAGIGGGDA